VNGRRPRVLAALGAVLALAAVVWWAAPRGKPGHDRGSVSPAASEDDGEAESAGPGRPHPDRDHPHEPHPGPPRKADAQPASEATDEGSEARPGGPDPLPPVQSRRERELPASHKSMQASRIAASLLERRARAEQKALLAEQRGDKEEAARQHVIAARLAARAARLQGDSEAFRAAAESGAGTPRARRRHPRHPRVAGCS
jgi:hypothetical protein